MAGVDPIGRPRSFANAPSPELQGVDRVRQPLGVRRRGVEVFVGAKCEKRGIGGPVFGAARRVVAAVGCAIASIRSRIFRGMPRWTSQGHGFRFQWKRLRDHRPAAGQTREVDEIETFAVAEAARGSGIDVLDGRSTRSASSACSPKTV